MNTLTGAIDTFVASLLDRVTVTPPWGAGDVNVTGKGADWPGATVTFAGRLIAPAFCTVTLAVAFTTNAAYGEAAAAVIVAAPAVTPVTGTGTVVAPAANNAVAGTPATDVALDVRFTVRPPEGAGDASVSVRFWVAVPVIVRVGGVKVSVVFPVTGWLVEP